MLVDECVCGVNDAAEQHESLFETRTHAHTQNTQWVFVQFSPCNGERRDSGSGEIVAEVGGRTGAFTAATPNSRSSRTLTDWGDHAVHCEGDGADSQTEVNAVNGAQHPRRTTISDILLSFFAKYLLSHVSIYKDTHP